MPRSTSLTFHLLVLFVEFQGLILFSGIGSILRDCLIQDPILSLYDQHIFGQTFLKNPNNYSFTCQDTKRVYFVRDVSNKLSTSKPPKRLPSLMLVVHQNLTLSFIFLLVAFYHFFTSKFLPLSKTRF